MNFVLRSFLSMFVQISTGIDALQFNSLHCVPKSNPLDIAQQKCRI